MEELDLMIKHIQGFAFQLRKDAKQKDVTAEDSQVLIQKARNLGRVGRIHVAKNMPDVGIYDNGWVIEIMGWEGLPYASMEISFGG